MSTKHHSDITFDDNSKITFTGNKARNGTTVYSIEDSKIIAKGNSSVVFNDLSAKWCNNTCLPKQPYTDQTDVVVIDGSGFVRCSNPKAFIC